MVPPGQFVMSLLVSATLVRGPAEAPRAEQPAPVESQRDETEAAPEEAAPEEAAPEPEAADAETPDSVPAADPEVAATPVETEPEVALASEEPVADDEDWEDDEDWDDDEAWDDDYDPLRDSPDAVRAKRRIVGGAVLIGLGALTAFGALGMGLSDPCAAPAGNSCSSSARNRAAVTMGLPGVAVLGAGIAVLVVGLRQRDRVRLDAQVSRTGGGVRLSGRF